MPGALVDPKKGFGNVGRLGKLKLDIPNPAAMSLNVGSVWLKQVMIILGSLGFLWFYKLLHLHHEPKAHDLVRSCDQ